MYVTLGEYMLSESQLRVRTTVDRSRNRKKSGWYQKEMERMLKERILKEMERNTKQSKVRPNEVEEADAEDSTARGRQHGRRNITTKAQT